MTQRPLILLSNDDGVHAAGLNALRAALAPLGELWVVAPEAEQSGVGHAITLHRALRLRTLEDRVFSVDGTPTDCVYLALHKVLPRMPDLVVSGINHGGNLGDDVLYSGTVGAALEAAHHGLPAVAVSRVSAHSHPSDFDVAAAFAARVTAQVLEKRLDPGVVLNVNVPKRATLDSGFAVCSLGKHSWRPVVDERKDPRGKPYFWIGGPWAGHDDVPGTDCHAIHRGVISITPLRANLTDARSMDALAPLTALGAFSATQPRD